jgi:hypothetical protein
MKTKPADAVSLLVNEPREVPALSLIFGYGPMIPFAFGAALAWFGPEPWRIRTIELTLLWGSVIITFLAGVRRGVSFRTMGGPTVSQIATMLGLFIVGSVALLLTLAKFWGASALLLALACTSVAVLYPIAARSGEAPLFFAKLRPPQMLIPIISLLALAALAHRAAVIPT